MSEGNLLRERALLWSENVDGEERRSLKIPYRAAGACSFKILSFLSPYCDTTFISRYRLQSRLREMHRFSYATRYPPCRLPFPFTILLIACTTRHLDDAPLHCCQIRIFCWIRIASFLYKSPFSTRNLHTNARCSELFYLQSSWSRASVSARAKGSTSSLDPLITYEFLFFFSLRN